MRKIENSIEIYEGRWFLPSSPEIKLSGTLTIKRGDLFELIIHDTKHLNGNDIPYDTRSFSITHELILGEISQFQEIVTLYNFSKNSSKHWYIGNNCKSTYECDHAFFGFHFTTISQIEYPKLCFRLDKLNQLTRVNSFDHSAFEPRLQSYIKNVFFENLSIEIKDRYHHKSTFRKRTTEVYPVIEINYNGPTAQGKAKFKQFSKCLNIIQNFLFFALGEWTDIVSCSLDLEDHHEKRIITTWHKSPDSHEPRSQNYIHWQLTQFKVNDISNYLNNWFKLYPKYSSCISVYEYAVESTWKSGGRSFHTIGLTNSLLNISQAIERMFKIDKNEFIHSFKDNKTRLEIDNDTVRRAIDSNEISFPNDDHKKYVRERLRLTQAEKKFEYIPINTIIEELCRTHSSAMNEIISENQYTTFSNEVKLLRDTLTHLHNEHNIEDNSKEFNSLFDVLQCLFYTVLFSKVGFTDDSIKKSLQRIRSPKI